MDSAYRKLKIMLLTPVGGPNLNPYMAEVAKKYKDTNTHVTVTSLGSSIGGYKTMAYPSIRSLLYAEMIRACLQARVEDYDAVMVNCVGDPMIDELRQISGGMLIIGAGESAVQTALRLGKRYSIMTPFNMETPTDPVTQRFVADTKAVSYRSVDILFNEDLTVGDTLGLEERLKTEGKLAVEEDGAEVLILGCTVMTGYYQMSMEAIGVPVIDPVVTGLKTAELSAQMRRDYGWGTSEKTTMNVPTKQELEMIGLSGKPYTYSGRIEVE